MTTTNKNFSNAVFTFLPPNDFNDPDFDDQQDDEDEDYGDDYDDYDSYSKAVDGSFDKSYFIDETTQVFRFPNYNADWKGLVQIRDRTPYKNHYFSYLRYEERKNFNIDKFEQKFPSIVWEIQDFQDFLQNLPASCFNKGINRKDVLELFDEYSDFINGSLPSSYYYELGWENSKAIEAGLMEKADKSKMKPKDLWENVSLDEMNEICKANGIPPAKTHNTVIKRLVEKNIPFTFEGARPTQQLKDCYFSFIDLYLDEIRNNTNHFHPLYFKSLWQEVKNECCNDDVENKVDKLIAKPYWKDRLYKITIPDDDDDEEDDD